MRLGCCALISALAFGTALADGVAPQPRPGLLLLRAGAVAADALPDALAAELRPDQRHVILLDGPLTRERRASLLAVGVGLLDFLPTHAFIADLSRADVARLRALPFLRRVVEFRHEWKLDPRIGTRDFATEERRALAAQGLLALRVALFPGAPEAPARDALAALPGAAILSAERAGNQWSFALTLPAHAAPLAAAAPLVQFVEELPEFTTRDVAQRWIVQSNIPNVTPLYNNGLRGEGQIVGVIDNYMAAEHCSFLDPVNPIGPDHRKIHAYNATLGPYSLHGTHVAGIIAGDPGDWSANRGIAFLARIVYNIYPATTEQSIIDRFTLHYEQGARVHTNSWGNDGTTAYDYACRALDLLQWEADDQLFVFAVTNTATLRNPENAKNLLAVGATWNAFDQDQYFRGGIGPTADGRRKPEIFAPGKDVFSAGSQTGCNVVGLSGTSMAAPAVAGVAALARQYFTQGYYPTGAAVPEHAFTPSGPLLKAMLINSAVDLVSVPGYPSDTEGWGRVLADNSFYFPGDSRRLVVAQAFNNSPAALATGDEVNLVVRVNSSAQNFRATLAFHDAPAAIPTSFAPVNDLDLVVLPPGGEPFLGNNFDGGFSQHAGDADPLNNLEQVHVAAPEPGLWVVRVRGAAVNVGEQGYALVVTGAVDHCRSDFNGDGQIDFFDYLDFIAAFAADDPGADFNNDGEIDFFDYLDFIAAFADGC